MTFYDWLKDNNILKDEDCDIINNIVELFNYSNIISKNKTLNKLICKNVNYNNCHLKQFMQNYGFIYLY